MLISLPVTSCLTNHRELCMSRLLSNQSRRISQRRPFFGFESSVSSTLLTDDDPVVVRALTTNARCDVKGKERKSIYTAPFCARVHTKRSGMDHTVLSANNTMPAFPSWRSPDVTTAATEAADIQLQRTTHLSTPKG